MRNLIVGMLMGMVVLIPPPAWADIIEQHFTDASGFGNGGENTDFVGPFSLTAPGLVITGVGSYNLPVDSFPRIGELSNNSGGISVYTQDVECVPSSRCGPIVQLNGVSYDNFAGGFAIANAFGVAVVHLNGGNCQNPNPCGGSVSGVGTYTGMLTLYDHGGSVVLGELTFEGTAVVDAGGPLFQDVGGILGNGIVDIRSVSVSLGPIITPEPSTWLLLGSGMVGLVLWRKKRAA
jgi:PEP-CTERM motif